jgi:pilus assembly protein TadC
MRFFLAHLLKQMDVRLLTLFLWEVNIKIADFTKTVRKLSLILNVKFVIIAPIYKVNNRSYALRV